LSRQCGILNISQGYRPPRSTPGIVLIIFQKGGKRNLKKRDERENGWRIRNRRCRRRRRRRKLKKSCCHKKKRKKICIKKGYLK
jgi:hypothetical protein